MSETKYAELADKLRSEIQQGNYRTGERLPSENELVTSTGFSRQTVRQAMDVLQREGLTERIRGSGTYVRNEKSARTCTKNIAVVTTYIGEYIFPSILHGIDHVLAKNGYTSLLVATRNRVDNERRMLKELLEKPIDGLIVEGTKTALPNPNIDLYEQFKQKGIPIVFFNGFYPDLQNPIYVVMDDRMGGKLACESLLQKGHRNIAGFFKSDDIQGHRRYAGYTQALMDAGLPVSDDKVMWFSTQNRDMLLASASKQILAGCSAAVCYNDEVTLGVIQAMGDELDGIDLASHDYSTIAKLSAVSFASLGFPADELGRLAAQKLLHLLQGQEETPTVLSWIEEKR